MLDLGCGIGHSFELLAPRETVGLDLDPEALRDQARETVVGDMRNLPFPDDEFDGAICVQAIEHVSDPERALTETRRVLRPGGIAVFVTPNRLTFGPPDEVIDPYHHIEFSPDEFRALCRPHFDSVELRGVFGSARYGKLVADEQARLDQVLRRDPLRLRHLIPRRIQQRLYDHALRRLRSAPDPRAEEIDLTDFEMQASPLDGALDLVAVVC